MLGWLNRCRPRRRPRPPPQPAAAAPLQPNDYKDDTSWLCRPGRKGDACDVDLTTTVVAADGTLTRETFTADPKAPIDCFYVYPDGLHRRDAEQRHEPGSRRRRTSSFSSSRDSHRSAAHSRRCTGRSRCAGCRPRWRPMRIRCRCSARALQYDDVRDAWQYYLKNDNQGRGVVLIGHSQGAFILQALIANEIDGKPVQKQLVGAYILGATFLDAEGQGRRRTVQADPALPQARPDRLRRELLRVPLDRDAAGEHAVRPQRRSGVVWDRARIRRRSARAARRCAPICRRPAG